jgi:hypothetical protein
LDEEAIKDALDDCLLTEEELALTPERWAMFRDPLPEWCD